MKRVQENLSGKTGSYILPFLWLRGENESTLRTMMRKIHQSGIREVCLEARPHPDFAGPQWWRDLNILLSEAESLSMGVWILDDAHFPTGFANGSVKNAPDILCKQYITYKNVDIAGPMDGLLLDIEDLMRPTALPWAPPPERVFHDESLISAIAFRMDKRGNLSEAPIDLTQSVKDGVLSWDAPSGAWRVVITYRTRNNGGRSDYINLLHKESVRLLIEAVYEPHYAHYGKYFGNTIRGFFSDEPCVGNTSGYAGNERIGFHMPLPWSPDMEGILSTAEYPLLWLDGKGAPDVRRRYMDAATECIAHNFSEQIGTWCESHGVRYIGHIIEDNDQHMRLGCSIGHFFRSMRGMHMAGIDNIGSQVIPGLDMSTRRTLFGTADGEFYHYTLGALARSLAYLDENKHGNSMCEIFGAYGWNTGTRSMKWMADHFLVNGINHYVPHAFSAAGFPDPDCPPHFYAHGHNPLFRAFGALMDYMQRVCHLITGGTPVIECRVLYPAQSYWMGETLPLQKVSKVLTENRIGFIIAPEEELKDDLPLIVCGCEHISPTALKYIAAHAESVLFADRLPEEFPNGHVVPLNDLPNALLSLGVSGIPSKTEAAALRAYRYHMEDGDCVLFFNESISETITARLPGFPDCALYDAWNNRTYASNTEGDTLVLTLAPNETVIVLSGETAAPLPVFSKREVLQMRYIGHSTEEAYPVFKPDKPDEMSFSGYMAYKTEFESKGSHTRVTVVEANEAVELFVNGTSMGYRVAPPYRFDFIPTAGTCRIRLEIANPLGNALRKHPQNSLSRLTPEFLRRPGLLGDVILETP